jgi:5,5'-dehydrodivanillate O-demethylase
MLSKEMNEMLTKVGPGTPAGELLRRYWQPICYEFEITDEKPKKRVKIMGEDLIVFRDTEGQYGCFEERCVHRGCSLYYGFLEENGLRCAYHGWKFDRDGTCIQQPFEPKESKYKEKVRQKAYPIEKLGGILFVYMGPDPAPLLPRWDVIVREDGYLTLQVHPILNCNWLQAQENSVDTVHTYYLHGHSMHLLNMPMAKYYYRPIEKYDFEICEWGIIKKRTYKGEEKKEKEKGHPAVFPNMLRVPEGKRHAFHWRVPIDDTHTRIFWAGFIPTEDGSIPKERSEPPTIEYLPPLETPDGEYTMDSFPSQDKMAWETQGPVYDRSKEHLGASDRGVAMWRKMLREQIEVVQSGGEPMALIRDPQKNQMIDFEVSEGPARDEYKDPIITIQQSNE